MRSADPTGVKRHFRIALILTACMVPLQCATLERLTLEDMIAKSSMIVRGKVAGSWGAFSGSVIYTHYTIQVSERLKGAGGSSVEIVVPGGTANNFRQSFSGAPTLASGSEYVFFLWTSRAGLTQVIGLTQGLFEVASDGTGDPTATRTASHELMLDPRTGRPVKDQTLVMHLSELRTEVASALGKTAGQ